MKPHFPFLIAAGCVVAWFAITEIGTEAWFRYKESQAKKTEPWNIQLPDPENFESASERGLINFQAQEIGEREREILHCETGVSASWQDMSGNAWNAFVLSWAPDKKLSDVDSAHNPTICLPAAGFELVEAGPVVNMPIGDDQMPFQTWIFKQGGMPVYVFMGVRRQYEVGELFLVTGTGRESKLNRALEKASVGLRGAPLQALQLFVRGPRSLEEATELAIEKVRTLDQGPKET